MEYTKETFLEHIEALRTLKKSKGGLNEFGTGRLALAEQVENLIICSSSLQLKEKIYKEFEEFANKDYIKKGDKYICRYTKKVEDLNTVLRYWHHEH